MIGLARDTIRLVKHDPSWRREGQRLMREVAFLGSPFVLCVEHVGSTAVVGLPAKPILDVLAGVRDDACVASLADALAPAGFRHVGERVAPGDHLLVWDVRPDVRGAHLHVVVHESDRWKQYLQFRDVLASAPEVRREYAALKQRLAERWPTNRHAYAAGKNAFIRGVLARQS